MPSGNLISSDEDKNWVNVLLMWMNTKKVLSRLLSLEVRLLGKGKRCLLHFGCTLFFFGCILLREYLSIKFR